MDKPNAKLFTEVRGMRASVAHAEGILTAAIGKVNQRDTWLGWGTLLFSALTAGLATFSTGAPPWLTAVTGGLTAVMAGAAKYQADLRDKRLPRLTTALSGFSAIGTDAANRLDMWNLEVARHSFDEAKALDEIGALRKRMSETMNGNADLGLSLKAAVGITTGSGSGTGLVTPTRGAAVSDRTQTYIYYPDDEVDREVISERARASRATEGEKAPFTVRRVYD